MIYFDTSYIVRLYTQEPGWEEVRSLAAEDHVACCLLGRAETVAAFHRKRREIALTAPEFTALLAQFDADCESNAFRWLPLSPAIVGRLTTVVKHLPSSAALRAADGLHLACAAENGHRAIYSNDRQLLAAAMHFGLQGLNVVPAHSPS
jgi:predicted nucleic acid-binding protein